MDCLEVLFNDHLQLKNLNKFVKSSDSSSFKFVGFCKMFLIKFGIEPVAAPDPLYLFPGII